MAFRFWAAVRPDSHVLLWNRSMTRTAVLKLNGIAVNCCLSLSLWCDNLFLIKKYESRFLHLLRQLIDMYSLDLLCATKQNIQSCDVLSVLLRNWCSELVSGKKKTFCTTEQTTVEMLAFVLVTCIWTSAVNGITCPGSTDPCKCDTDEGLVDLSSLDSGSSSEAGYVLWYFE